MLNVQEGQICICVKSDRPWWTRGKEYEVVLNKYGEMCFVDDDGDKWAIHCLKYNGVQFKRKETPPEKKGKDAFSFTKYGKVMFSMNDLPDEKEKSLDLNKLTIYQLQEYIYLQQSLELAEKDIAVKLAKKELAEYELDKFIERMTK